MSVKQMATGRHPFEGSQVERGLWERIQCAPPKATRSLRTSVLIFQRERCADCGISNRERTLHMHRIVPVRHGGPYIYENLVGLCPSCHRAWERRIDG